MDDQEIEHGHIGPPAARQIYLARAESGAWAIHEMTLGGDRCDPKFTRLSAGSPSLAKLIPDSLSIIETELANRVALTITHTPIGNGRGQWLIDHSEACYAKPDTAVSLALPVRSGAGDLWGWAEKHAVGGGYSSGGPMRFRISTLRAQVAKLFNPTYVVSDEVHADSPKLRDYENGVTKFDIWLRPNWVGEVILPDAFPTRAPRAPYVVPDRAKANLQRLKAADDLKAEHARRRVNAERIDKSAADWEVERARMKARTDAEAARKAAIEQRVRAELED